MWWCRGTMVVDSTEEPWRDSWRGDGAPMMKEEEPDAEPERGEGPNRVAEEEEGAAGAGEEEAPDT